PFPRRADPAVRGQAHASGAGVDAVAADPAAGLSVRGCARLEARSAAAAPQNLGRHEAASARRTPAPAFAAVSPFAAEWLGAHASDGLEQLEQVRRRGP